MKKLRFVVFALLICLLAAVWQTPAEAASGSIRWGDIVVFGSYPQSKVTDSSLITKLNNANKTWYSYPYYSKNTVVLDAQTHPTKKDTTMMEYADFSYGGNKYRAVKINKYRPVDVTKTPDSETKQQSNGYIKGNVYYFKYEPIRWIVVDASEGLVVSEKVLDAQPYNAYYQVANGHSMSAVDDSRTASSYKTSTIHAWLNADTEIDSAYGNFNFLNTAFSAAEQEAMSGRYYYYFDNSSACAGYDKVSLLPKSSVANYCVTIGENTDYAEAQGMSKRSSSDGTPWYLFEANDAISVYYALGNTATTSSSYFSAITSTATGIRPVLKLTFRDSHVIGPFHIENGGQTAQGYPKIQWESQDGVDTYRVYRCDGSADPENEANWSSIVALGDGVTEYIDTSAEYAHKYYYKVKRIASYGEDFSEYKLVYSELPRPTISSIVPDAATGKPVIKWTRNGIANYYYVYRKDSSISWSQIGTFYAAEDVNSFSFQDNEAVAGNTYEYAIKATRSSDYGNFSSMDSQSKTGRCILARPTGFTLTDDADGMPKASWDKVSGASLYMVKFREVLDDNWSSTYVSSTWFTLGNATPGVQYQIFVYAETGTSEAQAKYESYPASGYITCANLPAFTSQPLDYYAFEGMGMVTPFANCGGKGVTYKWYVYRPSTGVYSYELESSGGYSWSLYPNKQDDGLLYYAIATDKFGRSVRSNTGMIGVFSNPKSTTVCEGDTAVFSVDSMLADNVNYQWQYLASGSTTWKDSEQLGSKSQMLSVKTNFEHNGYQYRCVITDGRGMQVTSAAAALLINPKITTQPTGKKVEVGDVATFSVAAKSASTLKYQWQYKAPGTSTWKDSTQSGAKTATLSITTNENHNGYQYRCVVSYTRNDTRYTNSKAVTLTVIPKITTQPASKTVEVGNTAVFTVAAKGKATLKYQWQCKAPGSTTWSDSTQTGNKTAKLSVTTNVNHQGYQYRCVVTDGNGKTNTSKAATLSIKPKFTTQPASKTVEVGSVATFTVVVNGKATLKYQWQCKAPGSTTWTDSTQTGNKTAKLSVTTNENHHGYQYRCVVTDGNGKTNTSKAATLSIKPKITTQPSNKTVTAGTTISFTVAAKGKATLTYQWQYLAPGSSTWKDSTQTGAKTTKLTIKTTANHNGYQYRCVVKDGNEKTNTSSVAKLTVK